MRRNPAVVIKWYFLALVLIFLTTGCLAVYKHNVRTEAANDAGIEGTYTLILYGSRHINDIETIAIFDKEGDKYTFDMYAPDFDYKSIKGVPAKDALSKAYGFISWHHLFYGSRLSKILDDKGAIIGYELKPLYDPLAFGVSDVLDIGYNIKDNRVIVRIRLIPSVERMLFMDGSPKDGW